jgi:hypothetical protein
MKWMGGRYLGSAFTFPREDTKNLPFVKAAMI